MAAFPSSLFSQDDRLDELPFEEEELIDQKSRKYGAIAGGFIYNFLLMDMAELNNRMTEIGLSEFNGPMMIYGGEGFTAIPWVDNLRIGVAGIGGSMTTDEITEGDLTLQGEYSVTYTMLTVDYGFVVTDGLAILPGLGLGFGNQEISVYEGKTITWEEFTSKEEDSGTQRLDQDIILFKPHVGVEWAFTDIFMLRLNAGYNLNLATSSDWNYSTIGTATEMPTISPDGFNLQIGLFVGLFNY